MTADRVSICPRRILPNGQEGALDLGECHFTCAAFRESEQRWTPNKQFIVHHGVCLEYGTSVISQEGAMKG